jgi:hypothetical protein
MKPGASGKDITRTYCPPLKDDLESILLEKRGAVKGKLNTGGIKGNAKTDGAFMGGRCHPA